MSKRTPEGDVKLQCAAVLKSSGKLFFRMNSGITKVRGGFMHHAADRQSSQCFEFRSCAKFRITGQH